MSDLSILLQASIDLQERQLWNRACRLLLESLTREAVKLQALVEATIDQMTDGPHGRELFRKTCEDLLANMDRDDVQEAVCGVFEAWPEGRG